jgi:hypothetical protein
MILYVRSYVNNNSPVALANRDVVDKNPTFRRFDRFRRSAIVSSLIGVTRLYRPTPTD